MSPAAHMPGGAIADDPSDGGRTLPTSPSSSTSSLAREVEAISMQAPAPPDDSTDEELARFRRQWKEEVQLQRRKVSSSKATDEVTAHASSSRQQASTPTGLLPPSVATPIRMMRRAVHAYALAVASERSGRLDEALLHYRKAFKLDAHADQLYDRASRALQHEIDVGLGAAATPEDLAAAGSRREMLIETAEVRERVTAALEVEDYRFRAIKERQKREAGEGVRAVTAGATDRQEQPRTVAAPPQTDVPSESVNQRDGLSRLIETIINDPEDGRPDLMLARLLPADEDKPMPLETLPDELLQHIIMLVAEPRGQRGAKVTRPLAPASTAATPMSAKDNTVGIGMVLAGADYASVEQLARTCWKFRLLTRARGVWQLIAQETFFPPQLPVRTTLTQLYDRYERDWRTAFVEQPHVRLNGAYIAAYHYTRPGEHQDNVWVRVIHVVEFYRSLRFLPDGRVLSLLTTDAPSETVRRMDPAVMRGVKGFGVGRWTLHPDGLADDEEHERQRGAKIVVDDLADKTLAGYTFRIILRLDGGRRGRWDRIDMLEYESVNLKTGEVCPLPMNHKKPFHFSPVRSYGV